MIPLVVVLIALLAHWISDFVFQPHWMSMRKSKEWAVLGLHASRIYAGMVAAGVILSQQGCFPCWRGEEMGSWGIWALANAAAHFLIDAVTSRVTSRLYQKGDYHNFFVVIGFDQMLHTMLLFVFYWMLFAKWMLFAD